MSETWHKEDGETIDHGDGFVSHEVDSDKLPQEIKDALAESEGKPLISRGSFAQYAEDE
jgi:hypothetical protein